MLRGVVEEHQVGCCWMPATMEPRIQGDVQLREPGDTDGHQTRWYLSISRFSEAFSTFDQTRFRKQHKKLQKNPSSKPQWIYYQHLLFCMSSALLMWIMDSNGSGIKASQRDQSRLKSININTWVRFFQWKLELAWREWQCEWKN